MAPTAECLISGAIKFPDLESEHVDYANSYKIRGSLLYLNQK